MIKVIITDEMYKNAYYHAMTDKMLYGEHNRSKYATEKDRIKGSLGEEIVSKYFNVPLANTKDYDIIINGKTYEIKSRGLNIDSIKPFYEFSLYYNNQNCDYYIFVIVHNSFKYGWIVGKCSREFFRNHYTEKDFRESKVYSIAISQLQEMN